MKLSKWHGLGNDYLLVERAELPVPLTPELVKRICDYHFGVGSDGILEVVSADGDTAEVVIWNPDGSVAELSGNGTRIAARWLARRGRRRPGAHPRRPAPGRSDDARRARGRAGDGRGRGRRAGGDRRRRRAGRADTGLGRQPARGHPPPPDRAELLRLGPLVENHERFPERTNVQLVRVDGEHDITVGVWERGAGETLSSGTSAVAASAACVANGWCESPVTVHLAGGDLQVELRDGEATLTGPAEEICTVELAEEFSL